MLPLRQVSLSEPGRHRAVLSGIRVVLEQLDHVSESVTQLRRAAHLLQHAEEVCVRDTLSTYVREQVGVVGRLAHNDLCVVCVKVDLNKRKQELV